MQPHCNANVGATTIVLVFVLLGQLSTARVAYFRIMNGSKTVDSLGINLSDIKAYSRDTTKLRELFSHIYEALGTEAPDAAHKLALYYKWKVEDLDKPDLNVCVTRDGQFRLMRNNEIDHEILLDVHIVKKNWQPDPSEEFPPEPPLEISLFYGHPTAKKLVKVFFVELNDVSPHSKEETEVGPIKKSAIDYLTEHENGVLPHHKIVLREYTKKGAIYEIIDDGDLVVMRENYAENTRIDLYIAVEPESGEKKQMLPN